MRNYLICLGAALLCACNSKSQEINFRQVFELENTHNEVSGMVYHQTTGKLWMLQDKGNPSELYVYSTDGKFERTVPVNNQQNTDWEDLSQDAAGNLYIGDFGNNKNDRRDLKILKLNAPSLEDRSLNAVQETSFYYEDQKEFPPKKKELLYDCEAFVATGEAFYLFTKNRAKGFDGTFYVYKVPNKPGSFKAEKIATLKTCSRYKSCAVTGASINPKGNKIALSTHDKVFFIPFKNDGSFAQDQMEMFELLHHSQKEAVAFKNDHELYLADENEASTGGGHVYVLDLN